MYTVELIKGKTYFVMGHVFLLNQEKKIEKKVYQYLNGNEFFECKQVKAPTEEPKQDDQTKEKKKPAKEDTEEDQQDQQEKAGE
ncbi:YqbF domain-containing protein [Bacillus pumilus]|uniref:YqbF domain-containing protein n=1 Tax=Bacillus pumilus TaxID=1408 RepID=UPI003398C990